MTNDPKKAAPSIDEILAANGITSPNTKNPSVPNNTNIPNPQMNQVNQMNQANMPPQQQTYEQEQRFNNQAAQMNQMNQQYQQPVQQPVQQQVTQPQYPQNTYTQPNMQPVQQQNQQNQQSQPVYQQTQNYSNQTQPVQQQQYQNVANRFSNSNQNSGSVVLSSTDMDPEKIDLSGFMTKAVGGNTRINLEPNFYHARLVKIEKCRDSMPWAEQKIQDRYHCHFVIDRDMFGKALPKEVTLIHKFKISSGTKSYVYQAYTSLTGKYPQPEETINFLECLNKECLVDVQTRERDGATWSKICGYRPMPK